MERKRDNPRITIKGGEARSPSGLGNVAGDQSAKSRIPEGQVHMWGCLYRLERCNQRTAVRTSPLRRFLKKEIASRSCRLRPEDGVIEDPRHSHQDPHRSPYGECDAGGAGVTSSEPGDHNVDVRWMTVRKVPGCMFPVSNVTSLFWFVIRCYLENANMTRLQIRHDQCKEPICVDRASRVGEGR